MMKLAGFKKLELPEVPGVYFFKRNKEILYIGKAAILRDRVKSYFGKDLIEARGLRILEMVDQADIIEWQTTDSVLEALILEANLIKQYQPKYNILEKDDKSWNWVVITDEVLPKLMVERKTNIDWEKMVIIKTHEKVAEYFGPFPNSSALKEALKIVRKIFPFIDKSSAKKHNSEFYRQIGLAPKTVSDEARKEYLQNIKHIKLFFQSRKRDLLHDLEKEMMSLAKREKFEQAGEVKRKFFALQHIRDVALLKRDGDDGVSGGRIEAFDVAHLGGQNMVGVMTVVENGLADKSEYRKFKIKSVNEANDPAALREVLLRRLAHKEWTFPRIIVVDGNEIQLTVVRQVLKQLRVEGVDLVAVVKDERHKAKQILGDKILIKSFVREILLANSEAHRFAITFHRQRRDRQLLHRAKK